jgi:hypothetical protein
MKEEIQYDPNCKNKTCQGGVLVFTNGNTRLCKHCNPQLRIKNINLPRQSKKESKP